MFPSTTIHRQKLKHLYRDISTGSFLKVRRQEIESVVKKMGADSYDLLLPETHALALITHPDENIEGIVYGRYKINEGKTIGRGALVATNHRLILVDRKPLYLRFDELEYRVISGISNTWVGFMGTVLLHTRKGDISLRTFNRNCAEQFTEAIEAHIFDPQYPDGYLGFERQIEEEMQKPNYQPRV